MQSRFIITQGSAPVFWAAVSEIKGRKVRKKMFYKDSLQNEFASLGCLHHFLCYIHRKLRYLWNNQLRWTVNWDANTSSLRVSVPTESRLPLSPHDWPARSAAVFTIGAGTLADIFDPKERGTRLGIYYGAPLLGPACGPILGGGTKFHIVVINVPD